MSNNDNWIHSFTVTDTCIHPKGYTVYKITSVVFPVKIPEALTHITVWKRFNDVKKLHNYVQKRHAELNLPGVIPNMKDNSYFQRFHPDVVSKRKLFILELLDFIAQHSVLYKSHIFQSFFESINLSRYNTEIKDGDIISTKYETEAVINNAKLQDASSLSTSASCMPLRGLSTEEAGSCSGSLEENTEYFYKAASEFSYAKRAEMNGEFTEAFERYRRGIDDLILGSKDDHRNRIKAKSTAHKYIAYAEEVFKKIDVSNTRLFNVCDEQIFGCQKSLKDLCNIKVIQIFEKVMKVQSSINNRIYIMKVLQRRSLDENYYFPKSIPHMVSLVEYYMSDTSIFLLLEQASGGRLFDYIKSYQRNCGSKTKEAVKDETKLIVKIEDNAKKTDYQSNAFSTKGASNISHGSLYLGTKTVTKCLEESLTSRTRNVFSEFIESDYSSENKNTPLNETILDQTNNANSSLEINHHSNSDLDPPITQILPEKTLKRWFSEIIKSLHCLHEKDICCYDLHQNNILLGARGEILLSYFYGHFNSEPNLDMDNATPTFPHNSHYIAPERPLTENSDWWSAGIIFFELLTGENFELCHPNGITSYFEIQYPENFEVDRDLEDLLHGMLQINSDYRLNYETLKSHPYFHSIKW